MADAKAEKKATNIVTMKDVIFMFTSVTKPVEQLNEDKKAPLSDDPLEFHSFEIKILVTESRYKQLKKKFKGAKNLPNAKEHEAEALLEKYDFLNEDDLKEDDMVLIKFSQSCLTGNKGNRKPCYDVKQIGAKGKVQDLHGKPVDHSTNIGHGTKGHFQFRPVETKYGLYLYPHLLCITDLVEYVGGEGEEDLDALGLEDLDDTDMDALEDDTNEESGVNDDDLDSNF